MCRTVDKFRRKLRKENHAHILSRKEKLTSFVKTEIKQYCNFWKRKIIENVTIIGIVHRMVGCETKLFQIKVSL